MLSFPKTPQALLEEIIESMVFTELTPPTPTWVTWFRPVSSLPAAGVQHRGKVMFLETGGADDALWVCLRKADGSYAWKSNRDMLPVLDVVTSQVGGGNVLFLTSNPYKAGTLKVWVDSLLMHPGTGYAIDWTETNPTARQVTASVAPPPGSVVVFEYLPS